MNSAALVTTAFTVNDTLHTPLLLGRIEGEEIRVRYATTETLCEVYGTVSDGRAYSVMVRSAGKGFVVRWSGQRKVKQPTRTGPDFYWKAAQVSRHSSEAAAVNAAKTQLEALRTGA